MSDPDLRDAVHALEALGRGDSPSARHRRPALEAEVRAALAARGGRFLLPPGPEVVVLRPDGSIGRELST